MLNIVAIYAIKKTSSLSKNLKTLLLNLAVSDLGVGLLAQPMNVVYIMDFQQNNANNDAKMNKFTAIRNASYITLLVSLVALFC